jgi:hypothetical protein
MLEAAGIGAFGVELVEGLAPAQHAHALDQPGGLVRPFPGLLAACFAFAGTLVLDVDDGQPEQLDHGVIAGEVASGFGDLAELVVQRLDAVGGVEQLAGRGAEGQERDELRPGGLPDPDGLRVPFPPRRVRELEQGQLRGVGIRRRVDLPELSGDFGGVAARDRPQRVPDEMDVIGTSR